MIGIGAVYNSTGGMTAIGSRDRYRIARLLTPEYADFWADIRLRFNLIGLDWESDEFPFQVMKSGAWPEIRSRINAPDSEVVAYIKHLQSNRGDTRLPITGIPSPGRPSAPPVPMTDKPEDRAAAEALRGVIRGDDSSFMLGDSISDALGAVGITKERYTEAVNSIRAELGMKAKSCGCKARQDALNLFSTKVGVAKDKLLSSVKSLFNS